LTRRFVSVGECLAVLTEAADGRFDFSAAGDALATALALKPLLPDCLVDLVAVLGTDPWSLRLVDAAESAGIGVAGVRLAEGRRCGMMIEDDQGGIVAWREGAAARFIADDRPWLEGVLRGADAIAFSATSIAILPPRQRGRMLKAIVKARDGGAKVALLANVAPSLFGRPGAQGAVLTALATAADVIVGDGVELAALFGEDQAATLARLRDNGAVVHSAPQAEWMGLLAGAVG
jgi:2-dehydro-3-deoxygluconokinase